MRYLTTAMGACLLLAGTALADTINVPGDHATIQGAINASSNGDIIAIAAGTYAEFGINPGGRSITIRGAIEADGDPAVTVDGKGGGSVVVCTSGETSETTLENLVIRNGLAVFGGGMFINNSSPSLINCRLIDNQAYDGGGLYCNGGSTSLTNCMFYGNSADSVGGGMALVTGSHILTGCYIASNSASFMGGGLDCTNTTTTLIDCEFDDNQTDTDLGTGIHSYNDTILMRNSRFTSSSIRVDSSTLINPADPTTPGDLNGDGVVDHADVLAVQALAGLCPTDSDGDFDTDVDDLLELIAGWGQVCP